MFYDIAVTSTAHHTPTLLVHGGAWAIPADAASAHQAGVRNALETGYAILSRGGSSIDAVEAAVTVLEDNPTFDAGRGSFLTSDGRVQLDALLMDGGRMKAGGVACVERLRNPIQAARLVLEHSQHVYFVGAGAEQFAQTHGMSLIDNSELVLDRERERLVHAKLRESAGLGDDTFSGLDSPLLPVLDDDKSPETAVTEKGTGSSGEGKSFSEKGTDSSEKGASFSEKGTGSSEEGKSFSGKGTGSSEEGKSFSEKGTGFSPYIESPKETRALAPEGKPSLPGFDSHDTVGAVALDARGNLAAATSTGGTLNKTPGRVGDSSLIGCGCYADNLSAAVSLTGWGEPIMKLVLGKWATDRVANGTAPEIAAREAISYLFNRLGGHGGIILLGPDGRFGFAHNTPAMAWGLATPNGLQTGLTA
jgi:beta-aspartyl-peptidase (threonine type)